MIQVLVQITSAGASLTGGTFTVMAYNNGVMVQVLAVGVTLAALQAGITYTNVPIGSTHIRIQATNGPSGCTNYVDQAIVFQTTTTTTTTTTTEAPTTTSTTTEAIACTDWYNNSGSPQEVTYTDCNGVLHTSYSIPAGQSVCAQNGSISGPGYGFLTDNGPCIL